MAYRVTHHDMFETTILAMIIINSLKLVFDTYLDDNNPDHQDLIEIGNEIDLFFTIFFTLEALIKALAFGFVLDKNSYLREGWS